MIKFDLKILFASLLLLSITSVAPALARRAEAVTKGVETHIQTSSGLANNPVNSAKFIDDQDNGILTTVAEDGTHYVCDIKHGIAFIRKDGAILYLLHLDQHLDAIDSASGPFDFDATVTVTNFATTRAARVNKSAVIQSSDQLKNSAVNLNEPAVQTLAER